MNKQTEKDILTIAFRIRRRVLEQTLLHNGGYLSQACSSAEIFAALYMKIMKLGQVSKPYIPEKFLGVPGKDNPNYVRGFYYNGPKARHLDRFILSPTHYSLVLYAALVETGRMSESGFAQYNRDGSVVEMIGAEHSPGMEVMTGSLGQGISQAAGIALARKLHKETGRVWVFMSDGELQCGQVWEAIQARVFYKLDNMGIYVDVNGYQVDGKTCDCMNIEPLEKRFEAFGCRVFRVDGHNIKALVKPSELKTSGRPKVILCDTIPWKGIDIIHRKINKLHYLRFLNQDEHREYKSVLERMKEEKS